MTKLQDSGGAMDEAQAAAEHENLGDAERIAADDSTAVAVSSVDVGSGFLGAARRYPAGRFGRIACAGGGESFADRARSDAVAGTEGRGGAGHQRAAQGSGSAADRIREVGEVVAGAIFQPPL